MVEAFVWSAGVCVYYQPEHLQWLTGPFLLAQVVKESQVDEIRLVTGSAESAALRLRVPLQQVQAQQSPFLIISTWILMAVTLQTQRWVSAPTYNTCDIQNHCGFETSIVTYLKSIDDFSLFAFQVLECHTCGSEQLC